ncbi:hypothetical protein ACP26L_27135 [Paenibacillus sp. S-38]|uniref:hypothetical protein n=1 Tax=Paenibacillus sp. S-38 TaxID=3416710 RepID=UPI003CF298B6
MNEPQPPQPLTNQSVVRFQWGSYTGSAYSNVVHTPVISPMLTVEKQADQVQALPGQTLAYRIRVRNTGNAEADVVLFDPLPEGTVYVPNSLSVRGLPLPGAAPDTGIRLGSIPPQGEASAAFQLLLAAFPAMGRLENRARAAYSFRTPEGRLVHGEALSSLSLVRVQRLQVSVVKRVDPEEALVGDTITYRITIRNDSTLAIREVWLNDPLSAFAEFVKGSVSLNRVFQPGASPLQGIPLGDIGPGGSVEAAFRVRVTGLPAPPYTIASQAVVRYIPEGIELSSTAVSNTAAAVILAPNLTITKRVDLAQAAPGDRLHYLMVVTNSGNCAVNAVLTDTIPPGSLFVLGSLQLNGTSMPGAQPSDGIPLGLLGPGAQSTVTFQTTVSSVHTPPFQELLSNQAELGYTLQLKGGRSVHGAFLSGTALTRLVMPLLTVNAGAAPGTADPGDLVTVRIRVTNSGNTEALIVPGNLVPLGAEYVEGSLQWQGAEDPGGSFRVPARSSIEITYRIRILRHPHRTWLKWRIIVPFKYTVNGSRRTGRAESDDLFVSLDPGLE